MTRTHKAAGALVVAALAFTSCATNQATDGTKPPATADQTPASTASPAPPGSTVAMGRPVLGDNGNTITVYGWRRGADRAIASGPNQVYETVDAGFCAGPTTQQPTSDLATLFSLELPGGDLVAPDSFKSKGEFGTKGTVQPEQCVKGPIVYQVSGGRQPSYVVFASTKTSKWTVP